MFFLITFHPHLLVNESLGPEQSILHPRSEVTNWWSGSGPRSRPVRTRTYSQNRRFWFKTWRGACICNRRSFCSLYGSGLANQVCAFQAVNIATLQCRQMREWEASHTRKDGRKKQTDSDTGRENKGRETEEWDGERERNRSETEKVETQISETEKGRETGVTWRKGEKQRSETEKIEKQEWDGERERNRRKKWGSGI